MGTKVTVATATSTLVWNGDAQSGPAILSNATANNIWVALDGEAAVENEGILIPKTNGVVHIPEVLAKKKCYAKAETGDSILSIERLAR